MKVRGAPRGGYDGTGGEGVSESVASMLVNHASRAAAQSYNRARNDAVEMMASHLRYEHSWGIRKIGKHLGLTDREVKRACGESA